MSFIHPIWPSSMMIVFLKCNGMNCYKLNKRLENKMIRIKNIVCLGLLLAVLFLFSGCNTVKGAGKDIERGGEKIQDAAD